MDANLSILTVNEALKIRSHRQSEFDSICKYLSTGNYPELEKLLDDKWKNHIKKWIASIQPGRAVPSSQLHHLVYTLADDQPPPFHIGFDVLEERLQVVRTAVKKQGKTKSFRTTPNQLVGNNANQVHASLFEIAILYALIKIDSNLKLYPIVGAGNNDVEATISLNGRDIYCECTVRGYSPSLDHRQGAIDPYLAPVKMVEATLLKKMGANGQLALVAETYPTILITCVGFDIFPDMYIDEMQHRITETPCSASVIFERYHCNSFAIVLNSTSPFPLQMEEAQRIERGFSLHLGAKSFGLYSA